MDYEELVSKWSVEIIAVLKEKYGIQADKGDVFDWTYAADVTENEDPAELTRRYLDDAASE